MISSAHRFHGRKGLRYVYQQGGSVRGPDFALKSVVNPQRRSYRLAVVVSRKVEKSAVGRNRIRRRLYAAVRSVQADISEPYDIVITVFSNELLRTSPAALEKQLYSQLRSAGILPRQADPKK